MAILEVRRFEPTGSSRVSYEYRFYPASSTGVGPMQEEFTASVSPSIVERFCRRVDEIVDAAARAPAGDHPDHLEHLTHVGRVLYAELFPPHDRNVQALTGLIRDASELVVRTNEALVPWELLHDHDRGFLGLTHDLGRHYVVRQRVDPGRDIAGIRQALVVADPTCDLPGAQTEADHLAGWLEDHGVGCTLLGGADATLDAVVLHLGSGAFDLLHFSGHVEVTGTGGRDEAGLVLAGGELLDGVTILNQVSGGSVPVVFVNGCASAEPYSNLCSSFMATGSRVVVGLLHRVVDETAGVVAQALYARLLGGMAAGAALREARLEVSRRPDAGWASFVLFGNPAAAIPVGRPAVAADEAPVPPAVATDQVRPSHAAPPSISSGSVPVLDNEAAALVERARSFAAARGVVSSLDLFLELVDADRPTRASLGTERVWLVHQLRDVLSTGRGEPAGVKLSGTVTRILADAEEEAARAGRGTVGIRDLADAFLRVGGGSSLALLESIGLPTDDLVSEGMPRLGPTGRPTRRPVPPGGAASVFSDDGHLLAEMVEDATLAALDEAWRLAREQNQMISTVSMLLGFGSAGSATLRAGFLAQGRAGEAAARRLLRPRQPQLRTADFSSRAFQALERALAGSRRAGAAGVDDASVLRELLDDPTSSAAELLRQLDVDPVQLREWLTGTQPGGPPEQG